MKHLGHGSHLKGKKGKKKNSFFLEDKKWKRREWPLTKIKENVWF